MENKKLNKKELYPQEFVEDIVNCISDPVILNDLNLKIIDWNHEAENVYGWKKEEVLGKSLAEVIPIKNYSQDRKEIIKILNKKGTWKGEVLQVKKNGSELQGFASVSHLKGLDGEKIGYIAIVKDITTVKKTQQRLDAAQKSGGIGIFEVDLDGRKLWWSKSEMELLGISESNFTGDKSDFRNIVIPEDLPKVLKDLDDAIKSKQKSFLQEFRIKKNGEIRWISGKGEIIYDQQKKPIALRGANYDITDLKRLEENLRLKARVSRILSSSLNYKETLKSFAKLAVPTLADWCIIEMLTPKGNLEILALEHIDKKKIAWAAKWRKNHPPEKNMQSAIWRVINKGETIHVPIVTDKMLRGAIKDIDEYNALKNIGFKSVIIVPITAFQKTVGAISFVSTESNKIYRDLDRELTEQIASRASLSIENAILYSRVEEEKARLSTLLQNTPSVVWEVKFDKKLRTEKILFISDYIKEMLGYTPREASQSPNFWSKVVHPDDLTQVREEMAEIAQKDVGGTIRMRLKTKEGKLIWAETRCNGVRNNEGEISGIRGITVDITSTMESEERKDEFISLASHELRTPLTSLKVYNHLFSTNVRKLGQKNLEEPLEKMNNQVDKLSRLISDLLDLSRIQAGKLLYKLEPTKIDDLVDESIESINASKGTHKIIVKGKTNAQVNVDHIRIGQVLTNLLTNAIKYSEGESKVIVTRQKNQKEVIISVQDFGRGIPQKHKKKIFERFYQVDSEEKRTISGLGIGLYLASEIVKRHNGKIWVESKLNKGSTFYFSLPISDKSFNSIKQTNP